MRRNTLLGLALLVALAVGGVAPVVASAEEGGSPIILPLPSEKEPLKFTYEGEAWKLKSKGGTIECEKQKAEGSFTSQRLGSATMSLSGCTQSKIACKTEGGEKGVILIPVDVHVVTILLKGGTELGLALILLKPVVITCGVLKIELKGTVLGEFANLSAETKTKTATLYLTELEEKTQEFSECDLTKEFCFEKEVHKKFSLLDNLGEAFSEARETGEDQLTFSKEFEIVGASSGQPKFSSTKVGFSITSGSSEFKSTNGSITCKQDKGTGEITGSTTVTISGLTYEECTGTISGKKCPATITVNTLTGELGSVAAGEATSLVGLLLKGKEGSTLANIECETLKATLQGSVAGEVEFVGSGIEESNLIFTPAEKGMKITTIKTTKTESPKLELHEELASLKSTETMKRTAKGVDVFICLPKSPGEFRSLLTCSFSWRPGVYRNGWNQFDII